MCWWFFNHTGCDLNTHSFVTKTVSNNYIGTFYKNGFRSTQVLFWSYWSPCCGFSVDVSFGFQSQRDWAHSHFGVGAHGTLLIRRNVNCDNHEFRTLDLSESYFDVGTVHKFVMGSGLIVMTDLGHRSNERTNSNRRVMRVRFDRPAHHCV